MISKKYTQTQLQSFAAACVDDNQVPGTPGYCDPEQATWAVEVLAPAQLTNVFANAIDAREWLHKEIAMDLEDSMNRGWDRLLKEDIHEEVIVLIRNNLVYIWDGWHRAAAAIAKGVSLVAIVGRPKSTY